MKERKKEERERKRERKREGAREREKWFKQKENRFHVILQDLRLSLSSDCFKSLISRLDNVHKSQRTRDDV